LRKHAVTACIDSKSRSRWRLASFACRSVSTSIKTGLSQVVSASGRAAAIPCRPVGSRDGPGGQRLCRPKLRTYCVCSPRHKSVVEKYNRK
jgi:hypothetical protein